VSSNDLLWNCFAGCGSGDAVDLLGRARGLSNADACREFIRLAGGGFIAARPVSQSRPSAKPSRKVEFPDLTSGTEKNWRTLAACRNLSFEGIVLAVRLGLLTFGDWKERAAWFVTDATRHNAQARRMDGEPWPEIGHKKAWTICSPGNAKWPVGAVEAAQFPKLAFCEGGPDLLAAFHFIQCEGRNTDCSAVAMLGASLDIHREALPLFAGKRVRIFGHDDASGAGSQAVERWAQQLTQAGADVDALKFTGLRQVDGSPVKDLNDCSSVCPDDFENNRELWSLMP
jgi:hypothetical protein